jgi:hypothetical protein
MQQALTSKALEALKPQAKRYEVHDLHCPGLSVRISTHGLKTFSVKFRYGIKTGIGEDAPDCSLQ